MDIPRRSIYFNPAATQVAAAAVPDNGLATKFHQSLPNYQPTRLVRLGSLAQEIGVGSVYVKDETNRLNLPSFKILGASWGTFRAVVQRLNLPIDASIDSVKTALKGRGIHLYAATDGNHGRAVAQMGSVLSVPVEIHVPANLDPEAVRLIESEGATVLRSSGCYEDAISSAYDASKRHSGGIMVQDTAFEGYEDIARWIVDGYATMMTEIGEQLGGKDPNLVISPVGVGSLAQSVLSHFKAAPRKTKVATVEPDTAACLWKSLQKGKLTVTETTPTIMSGLDCGAVSTIAWPLLRDCADASLTVSDYESHLATLDLHSSGVDAGPCGASPLAALRRLSDQDKAKLGLGKDSVVVLICTEAARSYNVPVDVSLNDPVSLTQTLVQIDSSNPSLGSTPGPGETAVARYVKAWLEYRDIESHWIEPTEGRPSVVGVVRGTGGGKSLMLNGHIDTVTLLGYEDDPLSGEIRDGKLYGRGSADMKSGVAAAMIALARAKGFGLRGDVIFTGVADEEAVSIGTEDVIRAGWRADAAIVSEPTNLDVAHLHKGFVWAEVDIHGTAAHGSRDDLGIDAICKAGYFLVELDKYASQLTQRATDPDIGGGSVHASLVKGGEEVSSYPALCTVTIERRTIAGETPETFRQELESILGELARRDASFRYDVRTTFSRPPFRLSRDDEFVSLVGRHVAASMGHEATFRGERFWTDCALLADVGIKAVLWGPRGEGLHSKQEWADVDSIRTVSEALLEVAKEYCS